MSFHLSFIFLISTSIFFVITNFILCKDNRYIWKIIPCILIILYVVLASTNNEINRLYIFYKSEKIESVELVIKNKSKNYSELKEYINKKNNEKLEKNNNLMEKEILKMIIQSQSNLIINKKEKIIISNKYEYNNIKNIENKIDNIFYYEILWLSIEKNWWLISLFGIPIFLQNNLEKKIEKEIEKETEELKKNIIQIKEKIYNINKLKNNKRNIDKIKNEYLEILNLIKKEYKKYKYIKTNNHLFDINEKVLYELNTINNKLKEK